MTAVETLRRKLLLALFLLAVGGMFIHFFVHKPLLDLTGDGVKELVFTNLAASLFGLVDVVAVTFLFYRKETAAWGYLLNGLLVIYGTVIMGHYGIAKVYSPATPWYRYLLIPTSPDIVIAWADFFMGYVLFRLWHIEPPAAEPARSSA